jgi:hypothetical protein
MAGGGVCPASSFLGGVAGIAAGSGTTDGGSESEPVAGLSSTGFDGKAFSGGAAGAGGLTEAWEAVAGAGLEAVVAVLGPSSTPHGYNTNPTTVRAHERVAAIVPATPRVPRLRVSEIAEKATASGRNSAGAATMPSSAQTMPRRPVRAPAPEAGLVPVGFFSRTPSAGAGDTLGWDMPDVETTPVGKGGPSPSSLAAPA